jgi:hypothetical protein
MTCHQKELFETQTTAVSLGRLGLGAWAFAPRLKNFPRRAINQFFQKMATAVAHRSKPSTPSRLNSLTQEIALDRAERTLESVKFKEALQLLSGDISSTAARGRNEAEIASVFETRVYHFIHEVFNLTVNFEKEVPVETVRHIAKGRLDSRVGALVIEYKHHGKLSSDVDRTKATGQLSNYLTSAKCTATGKGSSNPREPCKGLLHGDRGKAGSYHSAHYCSLCRP